MGTSAPTDAVPVDGHVMAPSNQTTEGIHDNGIKMRTKASLPSIQTIQQIEAAAPRFLAEFEKLAYPVRQSHETSGETIIQEFFLGSRFFVSYLSLIFLPLECYPVNCYSKFVQIVEFTAREKGHKDLPLDFVDPDALLPHAEMRARLLRLLAVSIRLSPSIAQLMVILDVHWAAALLIGLNIPETLIDTFDVVDSVTGKQMPGPVATSVREKAAALKVLEELAKHGCGIQAILQRRNVNDWIPEHDIFSTHDEPELGVKESPASLYDCLVILSLLERPAFSRTRCSRVLNSVLHHARLYIVLQGYLKASEALTRHSQNVDVGQLHEVDIKKLRFLLVTLTECLCAVAALSQLNPSQLGQIWDLIEDKGANKVARLMKLSPLGSLYGERSDGYGFANHAFSTEGPAAECAVGNLLRLVSCKALVQSLCAALSVISTWHGVLTCAFGEFFGGLEPDIFPEGSNSSDTVSFPGSSDRHLFAASHRVFKSLAHFTDGNQNFVFPHKLTVGALFVSVKQITERFLYWVLKTSAGASLVARTIQPASDSQEANTSPEGARQKLEGLQLPKDLESSVFQYHQGLLIARELTILSIYLFTNDTDEGPATDAFEGSLGVSTARLTNLASGVIPFPVSLLVHMLSFIDSSDDAPGILFQILGTVQTRTLALLYVSLVKRQLFLEKQRNGDVFQTTSADSKVAELASQWPLHQPFADKTANGSSEMFLKVSLEGLHSSAAVLTGLRMITYVFWRLTRAPACRHFVLLQMTILKGLEPIMEDLRFVLSSSVQESPLDLDFHENWEESNALRTNTDTPSKGSEINPLDVLQSIVPTNPFTTLKQVLLDDTHFLAELLTVLTGSVTVTALTKVQYGERAVSEAIAMITTDIASMPKPLLQVVSPTESGAHGLQQESLFPSSERFLRICITTLDALTVEGPTFELLAVSESIQIAASAGSASGSTGSIDVAERYGGVNGARSAPLTDIRCLSDTTSVVKKKTLPRYSFDKRIKIRIILQMLSIAGRSEWQKGEAAATEALLNQSVNCDDEAFILVEHCSNSFRGGLQTHLDACKRVLIRLLLYCCAHIAPNTSPSCTSANYITHFDDVLYFCENSCLLLYLCFDLMLAAAPSPVKPGMTPAVKLPAEGVCEVSRFASTAGSEWAPGSLYETVLVDTLLLLIARLSHYRAISVVRPQNPKDKSVDRSLELSGSILRLWVHRCPQSHPLILSAATKQAQLLPNNHILLPLVFSCLDGLSLSLPSALAPFSFALSPPPIVAAELRGADGKNLEAVIARIGKQCLQKRAADSAITGVGESLLMPKQNFDVSTNRLPVAMTTLTYNARLMLPSFVSKALVAGLPANVGNRTVDVLRGHPNLYLIYKVSLAPPEPAVKSAAATENWCAAGSEGWSWCRDRLGRITMGEKREYYSVNIFGEDSDISRPDWTSLDKLEQSLKNSVSETAVETAYGSDRVPLAPFALSAAELTSITESRSALNEMQKALTGTDNVQLQLRRMLQIFEQVHQMSLEDVSDIVVHLVRCAFSCNPLLHVSVAQAVAVACWTHNPPILDLLLKAALHSVQTLATLLSQTMLENLSQGMSELCALPRLFLFIDSSFSYFPAPTLEVAVSCIKLAAACFDALQVIPVIDPRTPTFAILTALFDCLTPAAARLLSRGASTFDAFLRLLAQSSDQRALHGLAEPPPALSTSVDGLPALASENAKRFQNLKLKDQFGFFQQLPGTPGPLHTVPSIASLNARRVAPGHSAQQPDILAGCFSGVKAACTGITAILSQLPVAWDIQTRSPVQFAGKEVQPPWIGLSTGTVKSMLAALLDVARCKALCAASLFDLPDSSAETILSAIVAKSSPAATLSRLTSVLTLDLIPKPTILLEGFLRNLAGSLDDLTKETSFDSVKFFADATSAFRDRVLKTLEICHNVILIVTQILTNTGTRAAEALLPVLSSKVISAHEFFGKTVPSDGTSSADPSVETSDVYSGVKRETSSEKERERAESSPMTSDSNSIKDGTAADYIPLRETLLKTFVDSLKNVNEKLSECLNDPTDVENSIFARFRKSSLQLSLSLELLCGVWNTFSTTVIFGQPVQTCGVEQLLRPDFFQHPKEGWTSRLPASMVCLSRPFAPGLPGVFPCALGYTGRLSSRGATPILGILEDAAELAGDELWQCCVADDVISMEPSQVKPGEDRFLCLKEVAEMLRAGAALPTKGRITDFIHQQQTQSVRPLELSATSGSTVRLPPAAGPVRQFDNAPAFDAFRARRGLSSRAPSRHVDEFQAAARQQQDHLRPNITAPVAPPPPQTTAIPPVVPPPPQTAEDEMSAMMEIPEWRSFVADGQQLGVDVMQILSKPEVLEDQALEARFRLLLERHPQIHALVNEINDNAAAA